jgi:hypothetical protein
MRRLITVALAAFGLCCAAVSSAQEKVAGPAKSPAHAEACAADCPHKVCVAVPDKRKISKVEYACKEKDICLPRCAFPGERAGHGHRCDDACGHGHACKNDCPEEGCAKCAHPRTVRVLMKRTVTTECPSTKCEVAYQPAQPKCCPTAHGCHEACPTAPPAPGTPMPRAAETAPLPRAGVPALSIEPVR